MLARRLSCPEIGAECVSAVDRVGYKTNLGKPGLEFIEQIRIRLIINDYNLPFVERESGQQRVQGSLQVSPGTIINNDY